MVSTFAASTWTLVIESIATRSTASAAVSVTVIVNALLLFASSSVVSVAISPSVIVAVIIPVVSVLIRRA